MRYGLFDYKKIYTNKIKLNKKEVRKEEEKRLTHHSF